MEGLPVRTQSAKMSQPKTGTMYDPDSFRRTHATQRMKREAADTIVSVIDQAM